MRLFLDQMFHLDLAEALRRAGHDVLAAADVMKSQADDAEILRLASSDDRVLITRDGDFGDWSILPLSTHGGVVRVKTTPTTTDEAARLLIPFLAAIRDDDLRDHLTILSKTRTRRIRTAH